ncbi:MAG: type II secretion system F family protein [Verrucomicrobia bacterium]|nr:type II secretion system F family protein [Verrucomicrobiota bacterium]MCH8528483.1 type II secretion system F family protein [Kiritimatiellia bacterium]
MNFAAFPWMIALLYLGCFGLMAYVLVTGIRDAVDGVSDQYSRQTSRELENLFLFIPAQRIASLSQTVSVIGFFLGFLSVGNLGSPQGILAGLVAGGFLFTLLQAIPTLVIRVLKVRRLEQFNVQLTEALVTMSNSLRAGFSVQQAFEAIVQEGRKPISQEFGVFVQQTRVGVRFEDALKNLEERVGSDDLTLMVRAVEIARQTGGNLTEVFELIASTIRERTRIEGKIKSMTAMGRLQGIVVGMIPIFLMIVLFMLDPAMMMNFVTSLEGIAVLLLTVVLLLAGFVVIRKIVNIEV